MTDKQLETLADMMFCLAPVILVLVFLLLFASFTFSCSIHAQ